jgi:hypothetical protein
MRKWPTPQFAATALAAYPLWYHLPMVSKRRTGVSEDSSAKNRHGRASGVSRPKKASSTRTRTSLVGMTIYQPDLKPTPVGRKLLEALER